MTQEPFAAYHFFEVYQRDQKPGRKTVDYDLISRHGEHLGSIEFFSRWRQHVLVPYSDTVWSSGCLVDVCNCLAKIRGADRASTSGEA